MAGVSHRLGKTIKEISMSLGTLEEKERVLVTILRYLLARTKEKLGIIIRSSLILVIM
jgi:hypothetical protein